MWLFHGIFEVEGRRNLSEATNTKLIIEQFRELILCLQQVCITKTTNGEQEK